MALHSVSVGGVMLLNAYEREREREREREFICQINKQMKQIQISTVAGYQ